jgi:hypothetical protein
MCERLRPAKVGGRYSCSEAVGLSNGNNLDTERCASEVPDLAVTTYERGPSRPA